jgi:hypothetical protein
MLVQIFVSICSFKDEQEIVACNTNRRLVEIQQDSFLNKELHNGWKGQIQEFQFETEWQKEFSLVTLIPKVEEKNDEVSKEKKLSDKGKNLPS